MLLPTERVVALTPGVGWFVLFRDRERNFASCAPVACWAALSPCEDGDAPFGVVALIDLDNLELRLASEIWGFEGHFDEFELRAMVEHLLTEGVKVEPLTLRRLGLVARKDGP